MKFKGKIYEEKVQKIIEEYYTNYSWNVITDRALPDIYDGLKPVQRRIIYSLHENKLFFNKEHKTSAKIVGDVLGKYHPHGESSVYLAMIRLSQNFVMNYPLVDIYGNSGSIDGDEAAAMRYTQTKMAKISEELISKEFFPIFKFKDNYDLSLKEPIFFATFLPNILINGSQGIAVGVSTSFLPHNLKEILSLMKKMIFEDIRFEDIPKYVPGPEFPTGGVVELPFENYLEILKTGYGIIRIRAKYKIFSDENYVYLEFIEIPWMVSKSQILKSIIEVINNYKLERYIVDINDNSKYEKISIVLKIIKNVPMDFSKFILLLFKKTPLEVSHSYNQIGLKKNVLQKFTLKNLINNLISFHLDLIKINSLEKIKKLNHELEILKCYEIIGINSQKIIDFIRFAENSQKIIEFLKKNFLFNDYQCKLVLEYKLFNLSKFDTLKNKKKLQLIEKNLFSEKNLLQDTFLQKKKLEKIYSELSLNYGFKRKTHIYPQKFNSMKDFVVSNELFGIVLVNNFNLIKISLDIKVQKRAGKGLNKFKFTSEDISVKKMITAREDEILNLFTENGIVYSLPVKSLPINKLISILDFDLVLDEKKDKIVEIYSFSEESLKKNQSVLISQQGIIKKLKNDFLLKNNKNGKIISRVSENDKLKEIVELDLEKDLIFISSLKGKLNLFEANELRELGRAAKGVKGISLNSGDSVFNFGLTDSDDFLLITDVKTGFTKLVDVSEFRISSRGSKGVLIKSSGNGVLVNSFDREKLETMKILIISKKGKFLCFLVSEIRKVSRSSLGVKVMTLEENDSILSQILIN